MLVSDVIASIEQAKAGETAVNESNRPSARRVEVNGRHVWVVEDSRGIVEMTESEDILRQDHPEAFQDTNSRHL